MTRSATPRRLAARPIEPPIRPTPTMVRVLLCIKARECKVPGRRRDYRSHGFRWTGRFFLIRLKARGLTLKESARTEVAWAGSYYSVPACTHYLCSCLRIGVRRDVALRQDLKNRRRLRSNLQSRQRPPSPMEMSR